MEWEFSESGDSTGRVPEGASVSDAMRDLCHNIVTHVLPRNASVNWDHLLVDISADAGQFVVMPASTKTKYRIEKVCCQLVFDGVSERFTRIARSDVDDAEYERLCDTKEREWYAWFVRAAQETKLRGVRLILIRFGDFEERLDDMVL